MNSDRHYYIVNKANGNFLSPCILENRKVGWYGMAAGIDIYQYGRNSDVYQKKLYRQSFKWMIEFVDKEGDIVRFNNKWTGMYLAVKDDSDEEGARLNQAKTGSINWQIQSKPSSGSNNGTGQTTYQFVNQQTGKYMATETIHDGSGTLAVQLSEGRSSVQQNLLRSKSEWLLVEANTFEYGEMKTAAFKLKEDIRDNNWFKLAVPNPGDIPHVGATATAKIDAVGKMIGIFPDENELEELYNALVEAMEQIIQQALVKNELNNLMGDWNTIHINLNAYKNTANQDKLLEGLEDAGRKYAEITGRLMVNDAKEAGLILFIQAASEHLATINAIEALAPGTTGQGYMATATKYAGHLQDTFADMRKKRLALITLYPGLNLYPHPSYNGFKDPYQRSRIVGTPDTNIYNTLDEHRRLMTAHFNIEFGDPISIAHSWTG